MASTPSGGLRALAASRPGVRIAGLAGVTILALSGFVVPAGALPSEGEIAAAQSNEAVAADRVAVLDASLAEANKALDDAEILAAVANEALLNAQYDAEQAGLALETAESAATAAAEAAALASGDLASLAMSSYRDGGSAAAGIEVFLSADGFEDAMRRSTAYSHITGVADQAYLSTETADRQAAVAEGNAAAAREVLAGREEALAAASQEATDAVEAAETQRDATAATTAAAITELATLRNTTQELERERQAGLEEQRLAALEAAAEIRAAEASRSAAMATPPAPAAPSAPAGQTPASQNPATQNPATQNPVAPPATQAPATQTPTTPPATQSPVAPPATQAPTTPPVVAPPVVAPPVVTPPVVTPPVVAPPVVVPPASSAGQSAVNAALTKVGGPYVWAATGPTAFDCSGLTQWAYKQAGINLPRTTRQQWAATTRISKDQLQPGDLIFYSNNKAASGIYHVSIYTGPGMRVHAANPSIGIVHHKMITTNVIGYGRVG